MLHILVVVLVTTLANLAAADTFQAEITKRTVTVNKERLQILLGPDAGDAKRVFALPNEKLESLASSGNSGVALQKTTFFVDGVKMRADVMNGQRFMIVDFEKGITHLFDPVGKTSTQIPRSTDAKDRAKAPVASLKPLKQAAKINGFNADAYELKAPGGNAIVWVSSDDRDLAAFYKRARASLSAMRYTAPTIQELAIDLGSAYGCPVRTQVLEGGTYSIEEIVSVNKKTLPPETFKPEGYHP